MNRSRKDALLDELYAQLPELKCQGLCADACGPLNMSVRESQRIRERGVRIPSEHDAMRVYTQTGEYSCPALVDGRCSVYDIRPMICRLYGSVDLEVLRCPYGCIPKELITTQQARQLIGDSLRIGGGNG